MSVFIGSNLRLIRVFHGLSLSALSEQVGVSKQFLSRIEAGAEPVSATLESALANALEVLPHFFYKIDAYPLTEESCHFRSYLTTKPVLRQTARAHGEMFRRLIALIDDYVELPAYQMTEADPNSSERIELAAEQFRQLLGLGLGPLSNMTRIAEHAGIVVLRFSTLPGEIDAISFAGQRPFIALNDQGHSACRQRFGIAHEMGHLALHAGVLTGDRLTETQANRFASALLMPRTTFAEECQLAIRNLRLNWPRLIELKRRWGVSKAALIFRGAQLGIFSEQQARAGYINLKRHGEALQETEDAEMQVEEPELMVDSLAVLEEHFEMPRGAIAHQLCWHASLLDKLLN